MNALRIRQVKIEDLDACCQIESVCFLPSEAASRASIEARIKVFPQGFLVAEYESRVVGQINSGATDRQDITDESFKRLVGHVPDGRHLVVFSLSVLPDYRGRGVAGRLLECFLRNAKNDGRTGVLLLCKPKLVSFYERFGFADRGESASTHGDSLWHEMAWIPACGSRRDVAPGARAKGGRRDDRDRSFDGDMVMDDVL